MADGLRQIRLGEGADLDGFRAAVRALVAQEVPPERVVWTTGEPDLFAPADPAAGAPPLALPREIVPIVQDVMRHRDPERHALLYQLIWRVLHGERELAEVASDPLVHRLHRMRRSIARDIHKMHAFVRFRRVENADGERFVAWFEPEHFILEAVGPFFRDRFGALHWTILTPIGSIVWDRSALAYGPPGRREDAPAGDDFESGWRGYYESVFNPARVNPTAMRAEMPMKYWKNLPEAQSIASLVRKAAPRVDGMMTKEPTMPAKKVPDAALLAMQEDRSPKSLADLNALIGAYEPPETFAPKAVFGEGPEDADLVFVGEQPGDQEEAQGRPFVGPAGKLLARAMEEAGIDRSVSYLTNAVKHFKFEQRGKRRIHQKPTAGEVKHYRWWLMKELELVRPQIVVALGATAVLALTGKQIPITRARGPAELDAPYAGFITVHPSYLLRLPDEAAKQAAYESFVGDLRRVRDMASRLPELRGV